MQHGGQLQLCLVISKSFLAVLQYGHQHVAAASNVTALQDFCAKVLSKGSNAPTVHHTDYSSTHR
jgi:hypothetical protein